MSGFLTKARDQAINAMAKQIIGGKIKRYAELQALRIDTGNHQILLRLKLAGESNPLEVEILRYEIRDSSDGTPSLAVIEARADRVWLQNVLDDMVIGNEFPLPGRFASLIRSILQ